MVKRRNRFEPLAEAIQANNDTHQQQAAANNKHKQTNNKQHQQEGFKQQQPDFDVIGCICPIPGGCRVGEPVDPDDPGDSIKFHCSNKQLGKCGQVLFIHPLCCEDLEIHLLRTYRCSGPRARRDDRMERYCASNMGHMWTGNAYGKIENFCKCRCGGFLRKVTEEPPPADKHEGEAPKSARAKKPKKSLPPLVTSKVGNRIRGPVAPWLRKHCNLQADSGDSTELPGLYNSDGIVRLPDNSVSSLANIADSIVGYCKFRAPTTVSQIDAQIVQQSIMDQPMLFDVFIDFFGNFWGDLDELSRFVNSVLARCQENVLSFLSQYDDIWHFLDAEKNIWGLEYDFLAAGRCLIDENIWGLDFNSLATCQESVDERKSTVEEFVDWWGTEESVSTNEAQTEAREVSPAAIKKIQPKNQPNSCKIQQNSQTAKNTQKKPNSATKNPPGESYECLEKFTHVNVRCIDKAFLYRESLMRFEALAACLENPGNY